MIYNASAMGCSRPTLEAISAALSELGPIELLETRDRGHATELCRAAADDGMPAVVVVGGDGTMNEAANGLAGTGTALAPIPAGCTNVFARVVGLPADPLAATNRLLGSLAEPRPRRIDLGLINGRAFLFTSALGFSAGVVRRMHFHQASRPLRRQAWFAASAIAAAREHLGAPATMRARCAGAELDGVGLVVQNAPALTYLGKRPVRLCEGAGLETGNLSVAVLRRFGLGTLATLPARIALGRRAIRHPALSGFAGVEGIEVQALDGRLEAEADGEYLGEHDSVSYAVAPGALGVLSG